jgi:hypothetical protein
MEFDVVDLGALCAANAGGGECLPNLPGEMDKLVKVGSLYGEGMISDQKKPVAAPGNVTDHSTESGDFDVDGSGPAVARYVLEGHSGVFVQCDPHDAYRCLYAVSTGLDPAKICECGYYTDGSVPAHAQASAVVEENDARNAVRKGRLAEQCANYSFRGTWFGDQSAAEGFVILLKQKATLLQVAASKVRATIDDGSGRLTAGV